MKPAALTLLIVAALTYLAWSERARILEALDPIERLLLELGVG